MLHQVGRPTMTTTATPTSLDNKDQNGSPNNQDKNSFMQQDEKRTMIYPQQSPSCSGLKCYREKLTNSTMSTRISHKPPQL